MQLLLRVVLIREESAKNGVFHFHFINKVIKVRYLILVLMYDLSETACLVLKCRLHVIGVLADRFVEFYLYFYLIY